MIPPQKQGIRRKVGILRRNKKRIIKGKKPPSISKLMKEADRLFSLNLRANNADSEGICTCYTCGYRAPVKKVQAGHFVSRWYKAVRWNPDNVKVQCWVCNIYKKGDTVEFRRRLIKEIGKERVESVENSAQKDFKLTREYLNTLILSLKSYPIKIYE